MTEKRYFISLRGEQAGPFRHDELLARGLRRKTLVWNEEKWEWTAAETMDALVDLFDRAKRTADKHQRSFWRWLGLGGSTG